MWRTPSIVLSTRSFFFRLKAAGAYLCSANAKKELSYTSSPTICLHGVERDFTFLFTAKYVISSNFPLFDVAFKWIAHISPQI